MTLEKYIPINHLCKCYEIEISFFTDLDEYGLIEIVTVQESPCVHEDKLIELERMIRLHHELHINFEGIDAVVNLLEKISDLQGELSDIKNKLRLYEE